MKQKNSKKILRFILAILLVLIICCGIYVSDYYHADDEAIGKFAYSDTIVIEEIEEGGLTYTPDNASTGFIFYPGGKVEYTAYEPLMLACAERGIFCVLVKMPFNLAVLDINAADGIPEQFPEIANWYIGGHSLGGSMAATYLSKHQNEFAGLILLGSYSTSDISHTGLDVLSLYGSEDTVLNAQKYEKNKSNLPPAFTEFVIDGGCHAYFGMYGAQDGDGIPTISNEEQIQITADKIMEQIEHSQSSG